MIFNISQESNIVLSSKTFNFSMHRSISRCNQKGIIFLFFNQTKFIILFFYNSETIFKDNMRHTMLVIHTLNFSSKKIFNTMFFIEFFRSQQQIFIVDILKALG